MSTTPTSTRTSSRTGRRAPFAVLAAALAGATVLGAGLSAPAEAATGARTFYVDSNAGSDAASGTSPSAAWRTLGKINSSSFRPGDTVRLQRGDVWTGRLTITESGTAAAPITVTSYGTGARPVIKGGSSCVSVGGSWVKVSYLHADDCDWAGFDIGGDHVDVRKVSASHSVAGVFVAKGSTGARITYSDIYGNTKMSVLTKSPSWDDSGAFGIALNGQRTEVAYNTISGHAAFSYDFGIDGSAVELYESSFNTIHHNTIKGSSGFELGGRDSVGNVIVFNQLTSTKETSEALVTRGGDDQFGPVLGTVFANNSVYLTGKKSKGVICYGGCDGGVLTARNNIVVSPYANVYADGAMVEDHNVYWGGGSVQLRSGLGAGSKIANPKLVNPAKADLRIGDDGAAYRKGIGLVVPLLKDTELTGSKPSIGVDQP